MPPACSLVAGRGNGSRNFDGNEGHARQLPAGHRRSAPTLASLGHRRQQAALRHLRVDHHHRAVGHQGLPALLRPAGRPGRHRLPDRAHRRRHRQDPGARPPRVRRQRRQPADLHLRQRHARPAGPGQVHRGLRGQLLLRLHLLVQRAVGGRFGQRQPVGSKSPAMGFDGFTTPSASPRSDETFLRNYGDRAFVTNISLTTTAWRRTTRTAATTRPTRTPRRRSSGPTATAATTSSG